jgi:hypothetical protein
MGKSVYYVKKAGMQMKLADRMIAKHARWGSMQMKRVRVSAEIAKKTQCKKWRHWPTTQEVNLKINVSVLKVYYGMKTDRTAFRVKRGHTNLSWTEARASSALQGSMGMIVDKAAKKPAQIVH